ncbi:hypothetical protein KQ945_17065 [Bacillus subtilis subsp. subtilis]|nr:hypothetical protein [Bacillus subtilis subsp. subtilis]
MPRHALNRLPADVLDFNGALARVRMACGFAEKGSARSAILKRSQLYHLRRFALLRIPLPWGQAYRPPGMARALA